VGGHHGPVEALIVGSEEQLLATLDAKPLRTWKYWIVAIPARIAKEREQAVKLLEPKAVRVYPKATTLHSAADVDTYLKDLRAEIMQNLERGSPVII
jgi:hypothetical protein